jgi:hypothetical protein
MDATRFRFGAIVEWAVAAAAIVAVVALVSFADREVRNVTAVTAVTPVIAREASSPAIAPPAAIPPGAISVPLLLLGDGTKIDIGETASEVAARLRPSAEVASPAVERAPNGERVTRTYELQGIRFQLVFEPFEESAEPRVVAIYR